MGFKQILSIAKSKDQLVKTVLICLLVFLFSYAQHAYLSSVVTMLGFKNKCLIFCVS